MLPFQKVKWQQIKSRREKEGHNKGNQRIENNREESLNPKVGSL